MNDTRKTTFKGNPLTLIGPELKPGDPAPSFTVVDTHHETVSLADFQGRPMIINSILSVETGICSAQTRRFNEEAANLPPAVAILTISMDLPFGQKRFCEAEGIDRVQVLSDHRDASFGSAFGTLVKETRWLSRALFVVDAQGVVRYAEYLPEIGTHPNYDAALDAIRALV